MKKLVAVVCVLASVSVVSAQDFEVTVNVKQRPKERTTYLVPAPLPLEQQAQIMRQGGGCTSQRMGSGCYGSMATGSGCRGSMMMVVPMTTSGGCVGKSGGSGCVGSQAGRYGYQAAEPASIAGIPVITGTPASGGAIVAVSDVGAVGAVPVGTVYGATAQRRMTGSQAYYAGLAKYGERVSADQWATPSNDPPPPGIFGVPGARWPADGPIRQFTREVVGFDSGRRRR